MGPSFSQHEIESRLVALGARFEVCDDETLIDASADALVAGKALGWFQGRMEFGQRALGARSILADPRSPTTQRTLNRKVKFRESFRPFAPSVLREDVSDWFDLDCDSPYMMLVADVKKDRRLALTDEEQTLFGIERLNIARSEIPAVTHVDYSARIQTVHRETNPRYHALLRAFRTAHRMPGPRQHQLQRARRADRMHAGRRVAMLHGNRDRFACNRQLLSRQSATRPRRPARIRGHL